MGRIFPVGVSAPTHVHRDIDVPASGKIPAFRQIDLILKLAPLVVRGSCQNDGKPSRRFGAIDIDGKLDSVPHLDPLIEGDRNLIFGFGFRLGSLRAKWNAAKQYGREEKRGTSHESPK